MASNEQEEEIHVLMVAFFTKGHINPLTRLGKCLVSKGLHVTLAINEIFQHNMLKSTNSISEIQLLLFSNGLSIDYDRFSDLDNYMETLGNLEPLTSQTLWKLVGNILRMNKLLLKEN